MWWTIVSRARRFAAGQRLVAVELCGRTIAWKYSFDRGLWKRGEVLITRATMERRREGGSVGGGEDDVLYERWIEAVFWNLLLASWGSCRHRLGRGRREVLNNRICWRGAAGSSGEQRGAWLRCNANTLASLYSGSRPTVQRDGVCENSVSAAYLSAPRYLQTAIAIGH